MVSEVQLSLPAAAHFWPFPVGRRAYPPDTSVLQVEPGAHLENEEHACNQVHTRICTRESVSKIELTAT